MSTSYPYHILLVGSDVSLIETIEGILTDKEITPIQVDTPKEAIATIKSHTTLFSLVIVQQELAQQEPVPQEPVPQESDDMQGLELLKQVKKLCVGAMRILVTKQFEKELLMSAVNQRLVHKYISDFSDVREITAVIESAIRRFDRFREDEDLFALAKKQNYKLYELGCQHVELSRSRNREIREMNLQIEAIRNGLKYVGSGHPEKLQGVVTDIVSVVQTLPDPQKGFDALFSGVFSSLDKEFFLLQNKGGNDHE